MISIGSKQWAGRVNLRKIQKTNGLVGAKTGSKSGQAKKKKGKQVDW